MNRRALLKGLGRAVAGLALLPLVPLLPKVSPLVTGGLKWKWVWQEATMVIIPADRMTIYGSSVIHLPRPVSRLTIGGPIRTSEEEVSKITGISF